MKKIIYISTFLILLISDMSAGLNAHYLLFTPQKNNPGDDPYKFLMFVKAALMDYRSDKKRNPDSWESLWSYMEKQARGNTLITREGYKHKGVLLLSEAIIGKRNVQFRYIISTTGKWNIYTENDAGEDNWLLRVDRETPYRFFSNRSSEREKIKEMAVKLKAFKIKGFVITTGFTRTGILGSWKFYDESGFDVLIPFLSDIDEACYFRMEVAKAMKEIPDLYRFKERIKVIDEIIKREMERNPDEDHYRMSLIESLKELKAMMEKNE